VTLTAAAGATATAATTAAVATATTATAATMALVTTATAATTAATVTLKTKVLLEDHYMHIGLFKCYSDSESF
jgi:hypothetical protein